MSFCGCCHSSQDSKQVNPLRESTELQQTNVTLSLNDNIHTGALTYLFSQLEPNGPKFSEIFYVYPP